MISFFLVVDIFLCKDERLSLLKFLTRVCQCGPPLVLLCTFLFLQRLSRLRVRGQDNVAYPRPTVDLHFSAVYSEPPRGAVAFSWGYKPGDGCCRQVFSRNSTVRDRSRVRPDSQLLSENATPACEHACASRILTQEAAFGRHFSTFWAPRVIIVQC